MTKILLLCLFGMSLSFGDLNFDAIEEKAPTSSSISVDMSDGVSAANKQWKKKKTEDKVRAAYYRELYKDKPIQQAQNSQSSVQTTGSSSNRYICKYTCKGVNEVENKVQVYGKYNDDAQLESEKIAKKYCWDTFHTSVVNKWGSGETKCTKQ